MNREEMIKKLESFCENRDYCNADEEHMCPLFFINSCDFSDFSDTELENAYNEAFGRKITIPAGATNGDVIKLMFPAYEVEIEGDHVTCWIDEHKWIRFDLDWWNAPYKAESEEV